MRHLRRHARRVVAHACVVADGRALVSGAERSGASSRCRLRRPGAARGARPPGPRALPGWPLYDRLCLRLPRRARRRRGPAAPWLWPPPRDFTAGEFKWRGTGRRAAPDAQRVADASATARPAPRCRLRRRARRPRSISSSTWSRSFAARPAPARARARWRLRRQIVPRARPRRRAERGAALWTDAGLRGCHGAGGHGDGPRRPRARSRGRASPPYDLTAAPLRRPRAGDRDARRPRAASDRSIAWGRRRHRDARLRTARARRRSVGARRSRRRAAARRGGAAAPSADRRPPRDRRAIAPASWSVAGTWPATTPTTPPRLRCSAATIRVQGPPPGRARAGAGVAVVAAVRALPRQAGPRVDRLDPRRGGVAGAARARSCGIDDAESR